MFIIKTLFVLLQKLFENIFRVEAYSNFRVKRSFDIKLILYGIFQKYDFFIF